MFTGCWLRPVTLIPIVVLLIMPLHPSLASAEGNPCVPQARLYPSDQVEARCDSSGCLVTSAHVMYLPCRGPAQQPPQFVLSLKEGDRLVQESEPLELKPDTTNLEVFWKADLAPELLTVPPGDLTSSYYYLALVWEGLLSLFNFKGDPEQTDWGRVDVESFPVSTDEDVLFNQFVLALPDMAVKKSNTERLNKWLNEDSSLPRIAVILRWQKEPVTENEYRFENNKNIPVVIVDVGQSYEPAGDAIRQAGGEVISLGPVPDPLPDPSAIGWDENRERILEHVKNRGRAIQELSNRIRNVFILEYRWPILIDSEQLKAWKLEVRAQVPGSSPASAPLYFSTQRESHAARLQGAIGCVAFLVNAAAIFVGAIGITGLVKHGLPLLEEAQESWKKLKANLSAGSPTG